MYKFALIGCGQAGAKHAAICSKIGNLVAVYDTAPEQANILAGLYGAVPYDSFDHLFSGNTEFDISIVCSPTGYHAEHVIKSLQAGKHVIVEPPLCISSAAAWQMIETEKFSRRKMFVVNTFRQNPLLQKVRSYIANQLFGEIYSFQLNCFLNHSTDFYNGWKGKLYPAGGSLYNSFSQYIDTMLWLFGDIQSIYGATGNKRSVAYMELEDTGSVTLQMENNTLGVLNWSVNALKNAEVSLSILAENIRLTLEGENLEKIKYSYSKSENIPEWNSIQPNSLTSQEDNSGIYSILYNEIINTLAENKGNNIHSLDALKTVETIEKIYKAFHSK